MAARLNKVFLIGNLTRDPELRYVTSGQPVVSFSIAVNRVFTSQSGEKKEEASFIRVVVWGRLAEVCNEYLKKGAPIFVEGRLQSRSWEAQDGSKRNTIEVVANNIQFLGRAQGSTRSDSTREAIPADMDNEIGIGEIADDRGVGGDEFTLGDQPPF
ncbi:MAG: single-stranded DNA-binding protein [Candidatus Omnitrophica bacterium]|nr:single-stranded DNA-binding protein [Candidatus Omnitrophota bacterium]